MNKSYPKELQTLINFLKKLPGVGSKTAQRLAFHLLKWEEGNLLHFSQALSSLKKNIQTCRDCGCLISTGSCGFCDSKERDCTQICIISSPKDVYLIEETNIYHGLYHVVDQLLSPIDGYHEHQLHVDKLKRRIEHYQVKEVIVALDSTLEGDATALFFKNALASWNIPVSRLALGLPVGSSLEYIDGGTLARALMGRQDF